LATRLRRDLLPLVAGCTDLRTVFRAALGADLSAVCRLFGRVGFFLGAGFLEGFLANVVFSFFRPLEEASAPVILHALKLTSHH